MTMQNGKTANVKFADYIQKIEIDSLVDGCVTLRFRDTMEQERVKISDLAAIIEDKVSIASLLKKL